jgi:hypothetical protein
MRHFGRSLLACFSFIFLFHLSASAQSSWATTVEAPNAIYLEVAGNGGVYSLNYDRIISQSGRWKTAFRAGLSTSIPAGTREFYPIIPVEILALRGLREKNLELGLGYTHQFTNDADENKSYYYSRVGFRYQHPKGGLMVRVAILPYLYKDKIREGQYPLVPTFGISIGKSF